MQLKSKTNPEWIKVVLADFDHFLIDHALCERKASALAMSLVAHYPDKSELVKSMIKLAREELEHFDIVCSVIYDRGLILFSDEKDDYVGMLRKLIRKEKNDYFLDRLLVAGIIEGRGTERFEIVAKNVSDPVLKNFYMEFWKSEARHHGLFLRLAKTYFRSEEVLERYDFLLEKEAEILEKLPLAAKVH